MPARDAAIGGFLEGKKSQEYALNASLLGGMFQEKIKKGGKAYGNNRGA